MATIKSYTDIEQSKKLAEFLPIESADMCWIDRPQIVTDCPEVPVIPNIELKAMLPQNKLLPCWSLAALLGVLPNDLDNTTTLSKGGWSLDTMKYVDKWFVEYEKEVGGKEFTTSADNPIDACVEMILKLNELNLL